MAGYSVTFSVVDQATAKINAINKSIQGIKAPLEAQQKALAKFADVSGLTKIATGFKSVASSAVSAAEAMSSMVPAMGALVGAASVGGIVKLVNQFASMGEELTKTGIVLEETPEKLYGVAQAMRYFGGNADDAINSLKALKDTIYDAALGAAPRAAYMFQMLGVKTVDANKNFRDVIDVQKDLFAGFDRMKNPIDAQRAAMIAGGKAMADTYLQYKAMGVTLDTWFDKQKQLATLTAEQTKSMMAYEAAVGPLNASFYKLGTTLATTLAPSMTAAANALEKWIEQNPDKINNAMKEVGDALKWVGNNLDTIKTTAEIVGGVFVTLWGVRAVSAVLTLMTQVKALNAAISLGPLGLLLGAGAGAYKLGRDIVKGAPEAPGEWSINKWLNPAYWINKAMGGPGSAPGPGGGGAPAGGPPAGVTPGQPYGYAPIAPPGQQGAAAPAGNIVPAAYTTGGATPQGAGAPAGAAAPAPAAYIPGAAGTGDFIKGQEGKPNLTVGNDVGHPVIGYGHDLTAQEQKQGYVATASGNIPFRGGITPDQANAIFSQDYQTRVAHLSKTVPGFSNLNPNQQEALTSYYYNTGRLPTGLAGNIAAGNMGAISESLKGGIATAGGRYLPALGRRRAQEASLFMQPSNPTAPTPDSHAGAPHTPGGGSAGSVVDQMVALAGTRGAAVREFLRDPSGKIARDPDLGLWCAEFTQAYLRHTGLTGPGGGKNLMAASFKDYGQSIAYKDVNKGDILVNRNLKHVGVATGLTRTNPQTGAFEVQEVSSNRLGPGGVENLPGLRWRSDVDVRRSPELAAAEAQGAPGTMIASKAPTGTVDVNIRHQNAPAGTSTIAYATGGGINLNPPRIEHQKMSDTI